MQTVEWETFYIVCSWTELHELITIVVEYLIVSKLGSIYYLNWLLSVWAEKSVDPHYLLPIYMGSIIMCSPTKAFLYIWEDRIE